MKIALGCKRWTGGTQYGFRIYAPDIKLLVPHIVHPSSDRKWSSLGDFYKDVVAGRVPPAYSRSVVISDGSRTAQVTATFAKHGNTVQGYITAPLGSWLRDYVVERLDADLECEYLIQPDTDFIVVPRRSESVVEKLDEKEKAARQKVRNRLRRLGPPPDAEEIGLYFEILEFERLLGEFPKPRWLVLHRYPAIDSAIPILRKNDVSCDIDVARTPREIVRCVEVKSVTGPPGSPFNMTRREWDSRLWCARSSLSYEIVVYYHVRTQIMERRVIAETAKLRNEPTAYLCYPPWRAEQKHMFQCPFMTS